jgi:hypothetical protein
LSDYASVINNNLIIILRTKEDGENDWHYAKVSIKKNTNTGGWLFGTAPNRYVEVEISYQTKAEVPYAKRPVK